MEQGRSRKVPAKINLYLSVTGRREDGYHTIETVFWPLHGLADTVTVRLTSHEGVRVDCRPSRFDVPTDRRNTCVRAAELFAGEIGRPLRFEIVLEKRIPPAAGLGGGSADAAAVLRILNELSGEPLSPADLHRIAARIGADVPFFLDPRPAAARGIGDDLSRLEEPLPALPLLVLWPRFPVRAAWAYQRFDELAGKDRRRDAREGNLGSFLRTLRAGEIADIAAAAFNALEDGIIRKFPILTIVRRRVREYGALSVRVSGSGPCMFAVFSSAADAEEAARKIESDFGGAILPVFAGIAAPAPPSDPDRPYSLSGPSPDAE